MHKPDEKKEILLLFFSWFRKILEWFSSETHSFFLGFTFREVLEVSQWTIGNATVITL